MPIPQPEPTHIALPVTFISLLLTSFLTTMMASPTDKGLSSVTKATYVFVLILTLTTATAKMLLRSNMKDELQDADDDSGESDDSQYEPFTVLPIVVQMPVQRDDVSLLEPALSERAKRRKLQKQMIFERADREEEKRLRGMLKEQVKQRNNELLGKRKEAVVEVLEEEP
jgi:hypothetical protein